MADYRERIDKQWVIVQSYVDALNLPELYGENEMARLHKNTERVIVVQEAILCGLGLSSGFPELLSACLKNGRRVAFGDTCSLQKMLESSIPVLLSPTFVYRGQVDSVASSTFRYRRVAWKPFREFLDDAEVEVARRLDHAQFHRFLRKALGDAG